MRQPRLLAGGDRVAIVAPAGRLEKTALDRAIEVLESWQLQVVPGRHVYGKQGYFSGTDTERLADLQNALDDPTIAAILIARGGYGTTRILEQIQLDGLIASPKWLIGFSDITALQLHLLKAGQPSIHGAMGTTLGRHEASTEALRVLLFEGHSTLTSYDPYRTGSATGRLIGGNLSLVVDSLGTSSEIDTRQNLLFLEEIGEKTYRIDRMLQQLARAGKLEKLAGLVIGQFSAIDDNSSPFGSTWQECLERLTSHQDYPVAFGFPFGHEPVNFPLIQGAMYQLAVTDEQATLRLLAS